MRAYVVVTLGCTLSACSFRVGGLAPDGIAVGNDGGGVADMTVPPGAPADLAPAPDLRRGGFLDVRGATTTDAVDLSDVGTLDWIHFGTNAGLDVDRRKTSDFPISTFTLVWGSSVPMHTGVAPVAFSWTGGVEGIGHNPSAMDSTSATFVTSGGFSISAPADNTRRRLLVWVSLYRSQGQLRVTLSDESADPSQDTRQQIGDATGEVLYTIDYSAAGPGQTVTVSWTMAKALDERYANVGLASAALRLP